MKNLKKIIAKIVVIFMLAIVMLANSQAYEFQPDDVDVIWDLESMLSNTILPTLTTPATNISNYNEHVIHLPSDAQFTETAIHPTKPLVYAVDKINQKVYSINFKTGEISEVILDLPPESIAYANDELYLTLLKGKHSSFWRKEYQEGAIAVIDADSLNIKEQFDIDIDPCDIVADDNGYIYVVSGSGGQETYFKSYSRVSKQEISTANIIYLSSAEYNAKLNRIYSIDNVLKTFNIDNGNLIQLNYTFYPYEGLVSRKFRISPDGEYLFFTTGVVATCDEDHKNEKFKIRLSKTFSDVAFDLDSSKFYTYVGNNQIYVYDYNTFDGLDVIQSRYDIVDMYYRDNTLIALALTEDKKVVLEQIRLSNSSVPKPTQKPTNLKWNYTIEDSVFDPEDSCIHFIDYTEKIIASYNYHTKDLNILNKFYSPTCIDIFKEEIFVGYGEQGMIEIYDSITHVLKDRIMTGTLFSDFAVGKDGYIYIVENGYIKSFSRVSKQELNSYSLESGHGDKIKMHPTRNAFYVTSTVSPLIRLCEYDNGVINHNNKYKIINNSNTTGNIKSISPDGYYVFYDNGEIYVSSTSDKYDLTHITRLSEGGFSDIYINLEKDRIYAASKVTPIIYVYKYSDFKLLGTVNTKNISNSINVEDGNLIVLSGMGVEVISEESATIFPQVTPIPTTSPGIMMPEYSVITDLVSHPTKPYVYSVDPLFGKLILTNTVTRDIKEVILDGAAESVEYYNNEIYAGIGDQKKILIYDADTLKYKDAIITSSTFRNFKVGNDGYVYTSPGLNLRNESYVSSYSRISKQEVSKTNWYYKTGFIVKNPVSNILYFSTIGVIPSDILAFGYKNGNIISSHHSPYRGDYDIGTYNFISDDGEYIINETGNVFTSSFEESKDLRYVTKIGNSKIRDIAFDIPNNRFYVVTGSNMLSVYSYSVFMPLTTIQLKGNAERIFYNNSKLMALSKDINGRYYIESVDIQQDVRPVDVIIPNNLFIRQLSRDSIMISWTNKNEYISMLEYGTSNDLGSKTNWETIPSSKHSFILTNLTVNTDYYMKIHYKIDGVEVQSDVFRFTTAGYSYFDLGVEFDRMVYDSLNNKIYGFNISRMRLFVVDLEKYEIEKSMVLDEKPSDLCLSRDYKTIYIINSYGTISVFDTEKMEKIEDIPCTLPNNDEGVTHYHIYYNNNKLFLVDGAWVPGLWIYDIKSRELKDYSKIINGIGSMVFSENGNEFYYWYQYGWSKDLQGLLSSNIFKCHIDELGNISVVKKLYDQNNGFKGIQRDPLTSMIFLDESENKLYCKNIVLDTESFEILDKLSEDVYALAPDYNRFAGTSSLFKTSDLLVSSIMPKANSKNVFFDKTGNLYMCIPGDTRIFYYREEASPYSVNINGPSTITIDDNVTLEVQYNAVVKDQFNVIIPNEKIIWSFDNVDSDIIQLIINNPGSILIDKNTVPGTYLVNAVLDSNPNIKESIKIVIKSPVQEEDEVVGDYNGDGQVNSTDIALLRRYILGINDNFPVKNMMHVGDLNRDGNIDSTDYTILRRFILEIINELPYVK